MLTLFYLRQVRKMEDDPMTSGGSDWYDWNEWGCSSCVSGGSGQGETTWTAETNVV